MTAITDATLIIETIIGRTLTNPQLISIADAIVEQDPYDLSGWFDVITEPPPENPTDPGPFPYNLARDPTNEEKAALIVGTIDKFLRTMIREVAGRNERESLIPALNISVIAAQDLAETDMN